MITWREWIPIFALNIIAIAVVLYLSGCATPTMPMPDADLPIYEEYTK